VQAVLGRGCLIGLRVAGDARVVQRRLLELGFITGTSADPSVLRLLPPINLPPDAVAELSEALIRVGQTSTATPARAGGV
jgi:acetylornithine/succinyldiaminopimelate/putrescine aminotransferase